MLQQLLSIREGRESKVLGVPRVAWAYHCIPGFLHRLYISGIKERYVPVLT